MTFVLDELAVLPEPGDNSAIARRRIEAGTRVRLGCGEIEMRQTIPEGHRLVVRPVPRGGELTSWGFPFGRATEELKPGDYLCNRAMLEELARRRPDFAVPTRPNFEDTIAEFNPANLKLTPKPPQASADGRCFDGFPRSSGRGVGTRNHLVILGVSSITGPLAKRIAERLKALHPQLPATVDGIAAIAHTEGGESATPNNLDCSLRALAGLVVHPNVGAVLALDSPRSPLNWEAVRATAARLGLPLDAVPAAVLTATNDADADVAHGVRLAAPLLAEASAAKRSPQPVSALAVALQCGGSDAFNGVSSNPISGVIARETVRRGGRGNLAETDELMGAEPYILARVAERAVAEKFLATLARFEERCLAHGVSGKSNPSGGNVHRGLYNIALKSLGAARKKDPAPWLDAVIEYAEPMRDAGFHFMNSPGNDLESISGQVASGCNLIVFSTGNGSITNHPLVPTIKVMSSSARFELLSREMDFNAGRYLDGEDFETLGAEAFELALRVASGERSAGERAGHAQVQFWREWRQTSPAATGESRSRRDGPYALRADAIADADVLAAVKELAAAVGSPDAAVRLVIPTSLCAGQIALQIAQMLNSASGGSGGARAVALPHTEGCGVSGEAIQIVERVIAGYAAHPLAGAALLLEHGCEKTHNESMRRVLETSGVDATALGFASIQLDGGIERVTRKVCDWFSSPGPSQWRGGTVPLRVGVVTRGTLDEPVARLLATLAAAVVREGGSFLGVQNDALLRSAAFAGIVEPSPDQPTLAYAERIRAEGVHVMELAGDNPVEALTGLGACGATVLLTSGVSALHPFVPTLALDAFSHGTEPASFIRWMRAEIIRLISSKRNDRLADFQVNRGRLGIST